MEHSKASEMAFLESSWKVLVVKKKTKSIPIPGRGEIFDQSWGDLKIEKIFCIFWYFHYISFVKWYVENFIYKRNIVEIQKNAMLTGNQNSAQAEALSSTCYFWSFQ